MPTFDDSTTTRAPVEDVWKLLYDPARFPDWVEGVGTVDPVHELARVEHELAGLAAVTT